MLRSQRQILSNAPAAWWFAPAWGSAPPQESAVSPVSAATVSANTRRRRICGSATRQTSQPLCRRLQGVIIENKDALAVMRAHDAETTLYYIDPPYVPETRVQGNRYYAHEMTVFYNTNFGRDDFRTILAETVLKRASVIPLRFMVIHLYVLV